MVSVYKPKWKGLNRAAGYFNPYAVWADHPERPAMIATFGERFSKDWVAYLPREDDQKPKATRKGKEFATFVEAKAWMEKRLGIKGWERAVVNRIDAWLPNDDSPDEACEVRIMGDWTSHRCGRVAVPGRTINHWSQQVPVCSMHLKAEERHEAKQREWREAWAAEDEAKRRAKESERAAEDYAARLRGYGLKADVAYDANENCNGSVALHGETAIALMEWIELTCRDLGIEMSEVIEDITKGGRT